MQNLYPCSIKCKTFKTDSKDTKKGLTKILQMIWNNLKLGKKYLSKSESERVLRAFE